MPSANLQVTTAPASCSLAPQNPSQPHDNCSLINKHLTFTLCHEPQTDRITTQFEYSSIATASARQYSTCYGRAYCISWTGLDWTCKTRTCKTRTSKTRTSKTRTCKTWTQDRLLRTFFFFSFFLLDFFRVCKSDKTER